MKKRRTFGYYAVKTVRVSGWVVLALMVPYVCSGYALTGEYGCDRLMCTRTAEVLHLRFDELIILVFAVHVGFAAYLAMRRWGWIRTGRKTR